MCTRVRFGLLVYADLTSLVVTMSRTLRVLGRCSRHILECGAYLAKCVTGSTPCQDTLVNVCCVEHGTMVNTGIMVLEWTGLVTR